jgi:hypothetical protein
MTMKYEFFETPDALVKRVNTLALPQVQIVQIVERDGKWHLFYYS